MKDQMPQGVVAILVDKDGRELATATDFNLGSPGGFTQKEAQRIRVKKRLAYCVINMLSSPVLAESVDDYAAERIVEKMCQNGCNIHVVYVGYKKEEE